MKDVENITMCGQETVNVWTCCFGQKVEGGCTATLQYWNWIGRFQSTRSPCKTACGR